MDGPRRRRRIQAEGLHPDDGSLHPTSITDHFHEVSEAADLPPMRLHDLRHGAASLMPAAGIDMTVVSETLGHSTLGLTADTYTSVYRRRPAARLAPRSTPATFEDAAPRRVLASGTDSRCGARRRRSSRAAWCQIVPFWLLTYPWWATRLAATGSGAAAPDIADRLGGVGHERGSTSGRRMKSPAIEYVDDHCNSRHSDERNRKI
jgi:hypothetical protein